MARLPVDFDPAVRWGQCGLGALTAGVYFLFARLQLIGTALGMVLAHTVLAMPFVIVTVSATLKGFDRTLFGGNCARSQANISRAGADHAQRSD